MESKVLDKKSGLNANALKLIAILAMTVDHIAWVFLPQEEQLLPTVMHIFGRLTAPIMCFFISEGLFHTKNLKKYILRLLLFAVPSHFAYCFAFGHAPFPFTGGRFACSMLWTLVCGLAALAVLKSSSSPAVKLLAVIAAYGLTIRSDWYYEGVTMILIFGLNRGSFRRQAIRFSAATVGFAVSDIILSTALGGSIRHALVNSAVLLSLPLLYLYNGERGQWRLKWLFYAYYPAHLALLWAIKTVF